MQPGRKQQPIPIEAIPDQLKTQKICEKAVEKDSLNLKYVPNYPKFLEMCEKVVKDVPWRLEYVSISLITQKCVKKLSKMVLGT